MLLIVGVPECWKSSHLLWGYDLRRRLPPSCFLSVNGELTEEWGHAWRNSDMCDNPRNDGDAITMFYMYFCFFGQLGEGDKITEFMTIPLMLRLGTNMAGSLYLCTAH